MTQLPNVRFVTEATLPELVQDIVGSFITAGTNVTVAYNDAGNALTISSSGTGGTGTGTVDAEGVRDTIATALRGSGIINVVVDDANDTITISTTATTVGTAVVTAADQAAARTAIGAGTSSLALGTTSTTAKAGDYKPTIADLPAGTVVSAVKSGSTWPARPTTRTDLVVMWIGADPSPAIVTSGTGGMYNNDIRAVV